MSVQDNHEEKLTLSVDVNIPGHDPRVVTAVFRSSRTKLLQRQPNCWICGRSHELEAHHYPIERSCAGFIDWRLVMLDAKAGELGATQAQRDACKAFDWDDFMVGATTKVLPAVTDEDGIAWPECRITTPVDMYRFVDDMMLNGLILCRDHHIGKDEGIHFMPHPLWVAQRYAKDDYRFNKVEIIHHEQHE